MRRGLCRAVADLVSFDFYGYPELELSPTGVISYLTALQPWFGTPALQGFSLLGLLVARDRNESN